LGKEGTPLQPLGLLKGLAKEDLLPIILSFHAAKLTSKSRLLLHGNRHQRGLARAHRGLEFQALNFHLGPRVLAGAFEESDVTAVGVRKPVFLVPLPVCFSISLM
jgi:hypothetical protein